MIGKTKQLMMIVLVIGVFLASLGGKTAEAAVGVIEAKPVQGTLPFGDFSSPVWQEVEPVKVFLSGQSITLPAGTIGPGIVEIRALHNESEIAFRVTWADPEPDTAITGAGEFRDAIALEFPVKEGKIPFFGMGTPGSPVNIWHWKADWSGSPASGTANDQKAGRIKDWVVPNEAGWEDFRPGLAAGNILAQPPGEEMAENLIAEGFGTLSTASVQDVRATGVWQDGKWDVIFQRKFEPAGEGTKFQLHRSNAVAVAAWNGSLKNRGARKSTSTWLKLELPVDAAVQTTRHVTTVVINGLVGVLICGGAYFVLKPKDQATATAPASNGLSKSID
ncbi:MAG: ethylbenzene dehydrogenase-related protein [Thermincola sp.]|nr:ethylbenzene dehydrogenase-related protein [Thermincola sp.]